MTGARRLPMEHSPVRPLSGPVPRGGQSRDAAVRSLGGGARRAEETPVSERALVVPSGQGPVFLGQGPVFFGENPVQIDRRASYPARGLPPV